MTDRDSVHGAASAAALDGPVGHEVPPVTLVQFPPVWGRNVSPFSLKLESWLKLADIPYDVRDSTNIFKAPKGKLPYVIGIEMPVRHPATEVVSKSFESREIVGGGTISSNGGIATDDMYVNVELGSASGEAGLLAGDYSETITITVSPT